MCEKTSCNVLVVDDRPENIFAMEALLADLDVNIVTAPSGQEALAHLLDQEFAVVLLDVQMPEMDGFEVAELMKKNERTKQIPIIFVTAINKEEKHIFRGYRSGAVDYLFKPLDPDIVRSKVCVFLELNRQKKELEKLSEELKNSIDGLKTTNEALEKANVVIREQQEKIVAEERLKAILSMANATAHEMNQPLTVVLSCIELIKSNINEPAKMNRYLSRLAEAGEKLSDIVSKILSIQQDATKETGGGTIIDFDKT